MIRSRIGERNGLSEVVRATHAFTGRKFILSRISFQRARSEMRDLHQKNNYKIHIIKTFTCRIFNVLLNLSMAFFAARPPREALLIFNPKKKEFV
jgi:hypothetical protein